jgi:alkanesulfonate monooxygenase SsuD/methylene tetrahydromethanopterin reductase-like flavin-dependent oxidoreductase (luciferase family)
LISLGHTDLDVLPLCLGGNVFVWTADEQGPAPKGGTTMMATTTRAMEHELKIGVFVVPDAEDPERTVNQVLAADDAGLDLVGIQDHPYQRRFFDTWTLLSYLAGRTRRIGLVPDVANLPLRQPAVLAKSAASLDLLSGGRVELGLGAGAFWDAIEAMGGPRRSARESVDALEEAIHVIRAMWSGQRGLRVAGEHYRLAGVHSGPQPAHQIGIWLGAAGPRMMRITGRLADGWFPSMSWLDPAGIADRHRVIDEAARRAGRDPAEVRRVVNAGPAAAYDLDGVVGLAVNYRFDTILLGPDEDDPIDSIRHLGQDLAPRARETAAGLGAT